MFLLSSIFAFIFSCHRTVQSWFLTTRVGNIAFLERSAATARTYEEWKTAQEEIDALQSIRKVAWFVNPGDWDYDSKALRRHTSELRKLLERQQVEDLIGFTRNFRDRNFCWILSPRLYARSKVQTKNLIHEYVDLARQTIRFLSSKDAVRRDLRMFTARKEMIFEYSVRCLGRTSLFLQGGTAFSMCHLGVVKALLENDVLPQIITASSLSSFVAAFVCTTPQQNLGDRLRAASFDLTAFRPSAKNGIEKETHYLEPFMPMDFLRHWQLFKKSGHFFETHVIEQCARDNFGEMTLDEAYRLTGRILNIMIPLSNVEGTPQLLNYITAPHVFVWSAVVASVTTSTKLYAPSRILCKNFDGGTEHYFAADYSPNLRVSPIDRIGELFNVNHFIISQARPYAIPFLRIRKPRVGMWGKFKTVQARALGREVLHWLHMLGIMRMLPNYVTRILMEEQFPVSAEWAKTYITPDLEWGHIKRIVECPTPQTLKEWSEIGERSTWPHLCEIMVRSAIEFELEAAAAIASRQVDETGAKSLIRW